MYISVISSLVAKGVLGEDMDSNILVSSSIHMVNVHSCQAQAEILESQALNTTKVIVTCLELALMYWV